MNNRQSLRSLVALYLIAILSCLGSLSCGGGASNNGSATNTTAVAAKSPTPDPSATKTDKDITTAIYKEIDNDPDLQRQRKQINVISDKHAVTLWGWVENMTQHDKVVEIAKKTACVVSVDDSNFFDKQDNPTRLPPGGCRPPFVRCLDICQPPEIPCNSTGDPAPPAGNANTKK